MNGRSKFMDDSPESIPTHSTGMALALQRPPSQHRDRKLTFFARAVHDV